MFEQLLPMGVAVVEIFGDISDEPIFPGEEDLIEHAVGSRRLSICGAAAVAQHSSAAEQPPPGADARYCRIRSQVEWRKESKCCPTAMTISAS
jgi:hypothetical protein